MVDGLVRCVHPGIDGHVSFGTVLAVGYDALLKQSYMDVEDLEGRVLNAIKEYTCDLTVLGNYGNSAPGLEPVTSGHWDDIAYDSLTDTTTFTDFSATFPPHAVNWWLQPDAARSTYLEIVSLSASQVVVEGDATGLAHGLIPQPGPPPLPDLIGTFYTIVWPAGVDPASGTLAHNNPCKTTSRLLFAGYYYIPPVAGTKIAPDGTTGTTTYGQQPGGNHHGDYYCWNRVYAQSVGRWTTKDPVAQTPSALDYAFANPLSLSDPSGLKLKLSDTMMSKKGFSEYIIAQLLRICPAGAWTIDGDGYVSAGDPLFCEAGWNSIGLLLCDDGILREWVVWEDAAWESIADSDQRTACGLICKIIASEYEVVIDSEGRGLWTSDSKDANYKGEPWKYGDVSEEDDTLRGTGSGGTIRAPYGPSGTTFFGGTKARPVAFKPSGARTLGHELGHALRAIEGRTKYTSKDEPGKWKTNAVDESENIKEYENPVGRAISRNDAAAGRTRDWFRNNREDPYGRGGYEPGTDRKTLGVFLKDAPGMPNNPAPPKGAIFWD